MKRLFPAMCLLFLASMLSGCIGYYAITDPATGDTYYTRAWQKEGEDKSETRFVDKVTGTAYLLKEVEIKKISGKEYKEAVGE